MDKNQDNNQGEIDRKGKCLIVLGFMIGAFGAISWIPSVSHVIMQLILNIF